MPMDLTNPKEIGCPKETEILIRMRSVIDYLTDFDFYSLTYFLILTH